MRRGCGAVAAPTPVEIEAWLFVDFLVRVVLLGEARQDCFSQYNAGGDAVGLQVALPYYWGMQLQSPRRLIMVG